MSDFVAGGKELLATWISLQRRKSKMIHRGHLQLNEMMVFGELMRFSDDNSSTTPMQMAEISAALDISKPALSQLVNKLEDKGLVERIFSKEDRRATYLTFTEKGKAIYEREREFIVKFINEVVTEMGYDEAQQFIALANRLLTIAEKTGRERPGQGENKQCTNC